MASPAQFLCGERGKGFVDEVKLGLHHYSVHAEKSFECTHCGEKGNGRQKFLNHMRKHSTQKKVDKCAECQFETQKPGNLKRHMQIQNKVHTTKKSKFFKRCEPCGKDFDRKYNFNRHVKVHLKDPPQVFDCTQCEEKFSREDNLMRHQNNEHVDNIHSDFGFGAFEKVKKVKKIKRTAVYV